MKIIVLALAMAALCGCASAREPAPINAAASAPNAAWEAPDVGHDAIVLSLSGGGARAASYSLGVLQQLRDTPSAEGGALLNHVALITSVSGGSITAAYFGLRGAQGLDTFRAAYLDRDWAADIHDNPASPLNWMRAYRGALNGPDRLADWLDANVFTGARVRDFRGPLIWINATELRSETPFAFAPAYFDAICSDLSSVRVADAVAASMAVPVAFRPVLLEAHTQTCPGPLPAWTARAMADRGASSLLRLTAQSFAAYRDPARMRYLNLADGGIIDNFGLATLTVMRRAADAPYAPLSERSALRIRRVLFLVVNAERSGDERWQFDPHGPDGAQTLGAVTDTQIDLSKRLAYDAFQGAMQDWRRALIAWRCGVARETDGVACDDLAFATDMMGFADLGDDGARLRLAPTRVTLPADMIDALIQGGRESLRRNAAVQALAR